MRSPAASPITVRLAEEDAEAGEEAVGQGWQSHGEEFGVGVDPTVVLGREGASGEDHVRIPHNGNAEGRGEQLQEVDPRQVRQAERRQVANAADDRDSLGGETAPATTAADVSITSSGPATWAPTAGSRTERP